MAGAAPPLVPPPGRFSRAGVAPSDAPSSAATAKSAPRGVAVAAPGGSRSAASMEQRLAAFRAARRTLADRPGPAKPPAEAAAPATEQAQAQAQAQAQLRPPAEETKQRRESAETPASASPLPWWTHYFLINVTFLKFLLWLVLLGLFVELEFGLAYFVLSMFYWIYVGTRSPGERKNGERSAYSVFNPGCEAIQGTLTAEQFERELQYRPLAER
ncbi:hypothetical protein lerEdw1_018807 [Lerista edwardsae]|nr:hypothetical protein lerEdw1_018807 [Lerista edwardsae]